MDTAYSTLNAFSQSLGSLEGPSSYSSPFTTGHSFTHEDEDLQKFLNRHHPFDAFSVSSNSSLAPSVNHQSVISNRQSVQPNRPPAMSHRRAEKQKERPNDDLTLMGSMSKSKHVNGLVNPSNQVQPWVRNARGESLPFIYTINRTLRRF